MPQMKKRGLFFTLIIIALTALVIAGCSQSTNKPKAQKQPKTPEIKKPAKNEGEKDSKQTKYTVTISNFTFTPQNLEVPANSVIVWVNKDSAPHEVHADNDAFKSQTLNQGDTFKINIGSSSISYHCHLHPAMTGKITVK